MRDKFPYAAVAEWLHDGSVVPFPGAAASRVGSFSGERCPPDGRELAKKLVDVMPGFPRATDADVAKVAQYYEHDRLIAHALALLRKTFEEALKHDGPGPGGDGD